MSTTNQHVGAATMEINPRTIFHEHRHHGLEPGSYTLEKLRHSSANHMHMTNRRYFIGPIPKGWLQNHRKSWYKKRLKFSNYKSRSVTFSAEEAAVVPDVAQSSHNTPLDAPDDNGRVGEQESDTGDSEVVQSDHSLRTLPYPLNEEQAGSTPLISNGDASTSNEDDHDRAPSSVGHDATSSYFTAREWDPTSANTGLVSPIGRSAGAIQAKSPAGYYGQSLSTPSRGNTGQLFPTAPDSDTGSTTPLLRSGSQAKSKAKRNRAMSTALERHEPQRDENNEPEVSPNDPHIWRDPMSTFSKIATRYSLDDNLLDRQQRLLSRISKTQSLFPEFLRRRKVQEGEVLKAERMLVRVEVTMQENLPEDYSEFDSLRMESRVQDSWREFLVVCRSTLDKDASFTLEMYKTRVIPEIQKSNGKVSPEYKILLGKSRAKVNLYSALDKTIVLWNRCREGTKIYILRPKSTAHSVEWYTFITHALGWRRPSSLLINVPDLGVSILFRNPFSQLDAEHDPKHQGEETLPRSAAVERFACASIIRGCMEILGNHSEWVDVLNEWSNPGSMGLAWKRYDRLEWVFGLNEEKMYGSLAMQGTHELELRPRQHYSTFVHSSDKREDEPKPVEGFLVRLTSQKGVHQRMNRMFFKRLYFFCQDHYLFFCKPSKALPPSPPRLCRRESGIPSTQEILNEMPLSYDVDPFPIQNGQISWLSSGNDDHTKHHDQEAYAQLQRNIHNLSHSEGFINMRKIQEVRPMNDGRSADRDAGQTQGTDPHRSGRDNPITGDNELSTEQFDGDEAFEIVLENSLVARFRAFNKVTRDEWIKRLDSLVKYWKARTAADTAELKAIRQRNLELLGIDEELESFIGQFAKKWEVTKAEASPYLHNMCSLSGCRPIKLSGKLYKKPRRHATFKLCYVVLTSGKLLIYEDSLRRQNGTAMPHIHHRLESTIDLDDCYIYSGLLTESDLLYSNQTFDSNHPGHRTLPRVYLSSNIYTSTDEDTAITFVVWQPLRKNLFRARELGEKGQTRQTLKQVPKLGVHGRTIVFKARSRVEKDRWVLSIASEIDQLQEGKPEDLRLTASG